jgi:GGDEF domain-containing protein
VPWQATPLLLPLAMLGVLGVLAMPRAGEWLPYGIVIAPLGVYVALRIGRPAGLPVMALELAAFEITVVAAGRLHRAIRQFQEAVHRLCTASSDPAQPFDVGQSEIYREIRRARRYQRPATLLAIATDPAGLDDAAAVQRLIAEIERDTLSQYVVARVGEILAAETKHCDVVTRRNGHFIALLPETTRENAGRLAERLQATIATRLGVKLRFGTAAFPDDEVTCVRLLERAEQELARVPEASGAAPAVGG